VKKLFVASLFLLALLFISLTYNDFIQAPVKEETKNFVGNSEKKNELKALDTYKESIHQYLNASDNKIIETFGDPNRVDPSAYGYDWWIYNKDHESYIQIGLKDNKVVTIFVMGENINTEPYSITSPSSSIFKSIPLVGAIDIDYQEGSYRFELSEEEMVIRPLVAIGDNWAQLYFDKFTQQLSSIRYLTPEILIMQRPYNMSFRGDLVEPPELAEELWEDIEDGEEQQILDLTNILRGRHQAKLVKWHEETAKVAYGHSKEMFEENYFSHTSPVSGDLASRLTDGGVMYSQAGENIAANYTDAAAAVIGWLNSDGHRKTMLDDVYSHLGIGVYQKHYTQNFILPWSKE
jgi:uncharacterized protein YkwD